MPSSLAKSNRDSLTSPEETVLKIRQGGEDLRNSFIAQYQPFIASVTARLINAPATGRDEFSIAMNAFNEAIDRYDPSRNRSFLSWCDLVINHRVIDYIRSNRKHALTYPFTYFEAEGKEGTVERSIQQNPAMLMDHLEIKEEIHAFRERLGVFGIRMADLVECAPKHIDTKVMCIMLARKVASTGEMAAKLERTGQLPVSALLDSMQIGRKAVENNRKYIIALYIILTSGMEIIKGYINFVEEGVTVK